MPKAEDLAERKFTGVHHKIAAASEAKAAEACAAGEPELCAESLNAQAVQTAAARILCPIVQHSFDELVLFGRGGQQCVAIHYQWHPDPHPIYAKFDPSITWLPHEGVMDFAIAHCVPFSGVHDPETLASCFFRVHDSMYGPVRDKQGRPITPGAFMISQGLRKYLAVVLDSIDKAIREEGMDGIYDLGAQAEEYCRKRFREICSDNVGFPTAVMHNVLEDEARNGGEAFRLTPKGTIAHDASN